MSKLDEPASTGWTIKMFFAFLFVPIGVVMPLLLGVIGSFRIELIAFPIMATGLCVFCFIGACVLAKAREADEAETEQYVQDRIAEERKKWEAKKQ